MPAYRAMTTADARKASDTLRLASGLVQAGQARDQRQAFSMLMAYDSEGVMLARRASKAGSNPERKRFRLEHPLFAKFYTDAAELAA
jgi:hypothetical protein